MVHALLFGPITVQFVLSVNMFLLQLRGQLREALKYEATGMELGDEQPSKKGKMKLVYGTNVESILLILTVFISLIQVWTATSGTRQRKPSLTQLLGLELPIMRLNLRNVKLCMKNTEMS